MKLEYEIAENGCFLVTSHQKNRPGIDEKGNLIYPYLRSGGKLVAAHRFIYQELFGELSSNDMLKHTCGNGRCINPEHMKVSSRHDHALDMVERRIAGKRSEKLTDSEYRLAQLLLKKHSRKEVADMLNASIGAVNAVELIEIEI